jgi:ABC-type multidrug transport system fused ATPase/permease subunit
MANVSSSSATHIRWIRRVRFIQAILAIGVLAAASWLAASAPFAQWWFWVAVGTVVAIAIVEPYFTGATAALVFGIAALGTAISAKHDGVMPLWVAYVFLALGIVMSSVITLLANDGPLHDGAQWISRRFGRPIWLGLTALVIEMLRMASHGSSSGAIHLAFGTLLAVILAVPPWYQILLLTGTTAGGIATAETAVEPNLLLLATENRLASGTVVEVVGTGTSRGVVVGNLAHKAGNRTQVALEKPWHEVVQASGQPCEIRMFADPPEPPLAVVSEGTTERSLCIKPFGRISVGETVYVRDERTDQKHLYQITSLELVRESWDSSTVIEQRARAVMLGSIQSGSLTFAPSLPMPYSLVYKASSVTAALPNGYERIGIIAGTGVPFGISVSHLRTHHLAILGMSGMGKSTISHRIVSFLEDESVVIAVDGTGEYRTRHDMLPWNDSVGLSTVGSWVYEPRGVPAQKASEFIQKVMSAASTEYQGGRPSLRTILIEEAHSFLPEWNFTSSRNESDYVSSSCRCILQARKFGLSFILISQRTAVITKSALSQCESYIVFRTLDETSLQYIEGVLGHDFRETVSGLSRYQAACVGPAFSTTTPVVVDLDPPERSDSDA